MGIKMWNALPNNLKHLPSLKSFNCELSKIKCISKQSKITRNLYSHGDRINNIAHACLRMGCSKLNAHLTKTLHVLENESCMCGYPIEDTEHFLWHCPLYDSIRYILRDVVSSLGNLQFNIDILLFGSEHLNYKQNLTIFDAVHLFIAESK